MKKTLFSRHIKKKDIGTDIDIICSDIRKFNDIKRRAFALSSPKYTGTLEKSVHLMLKEEFSVNDYFANSALQEADAARRSVIELMSIYVDEKKDRIKKMEQKVSELEKRLKHLDDEKDSLIRMSKAEKQHKRPSKFKFYKGGCESMNDDGSFVVRGYKKDRVYANAYLFEVQYLDPLRKQLKSQIRSVSQRIEHTKAEITKLEDRIKSNDVSLCFGTKKRFKKQFYLEDMACAQHPDMEKKRAAAPVHEEWKHTWDRSRNNGMTISGRKDATDGNFVFRYDTIGHKLAYKSIAGRNITIPVVFPYGQELVDKAVNAAKRKNKNFVPGPDDWERQAVCWRIENHGNSFIIKCMIDVPEERKNMDFTNGCIGMDTNFDNFGAVETDKYGNLLHHYVISFGDIRGLTEEQITQKLSVALEKVFDICRKTGKPLAMEKLKDIKGEKLYQGKELNAILSTFAYNKVTELVLSKSEKYCIGVWMVNPAFTSQMGKMRYMRRFGLTVHESAAFVIARRATGFKEKVPVNLRHLIPEAKLTGKHHWSHWRHLHNTLKDIPWRNVYKKPPGTKDISAPKEIRNYYSPAV